MLYAEGEVMFPYLQGLGLSFTLEEAYPLQHHLQLQLQEEEELLRHLYDDTSISDGCNSNISGNTDNSTDGSYYYCNTHNNLPIISDSFLGSDLAMTPAIAEYDLGAEADLFKVPEPIIEEPIPMLDPLTAAISMISCCEDITPTETIRGKGMEAIDNEHMLSEIFCDCNNDLLEQTLMDEAFPELADIIFPALDLENEQGTQMGNAVAGEEAMQKSVSYGCLTSKEWTNGGGPARPSFLGFQEIDLGAAFGLRRAYSEGDIKALGNGSTVILTNTALIQHPCERMLTVEDYKIEERRRKISRYMKKKTKRNFGRKIKYACRKALADNQPRVRGRFARIEECEVVKLSSK